VLLVPGISISLGLRVLLVLPVVVATEAAMSTDCEGCPRVSVVTVQQQRRNGWIQ
jgi:hypothetical protein